MSNNNRLPFLDVMVDATLGNLITDVYRKPTDAGKCMNGDGECSKDYKKGVIRAYVKRALNICSTWPLLHHELNHIRQMLVNNGYSNTDFDIVTNKMIERHLSERPATRRDDIMVFYQNTFTSAYEKDEKAVRDIVMRNCKPTDEDKKIRFVPYYRNPRTSSLVMRNNMAGRSDKLARTNVVYEYSCNTGDCARTLQLKLHWPHNMPTHSSFVFSFTGRSHKTTSFATSWY